MLTRWVTRLLSLPFQWLGQMLMVLKAPLALHLLRVAWHISGDGQVGRMAVSACYRLRGIEEAWAMAAAWVASRPRAEVAAIAGLLALQRGERDVAADLLNTGRSIDTRRDPMLDILEFAVASENGDDTVAERLDLAHDLSPELTRMVRGELAWRAMLAGHFDEARRRADRLLAVEDNTQAEMVLWALARHSGDTSAASRHLTRASKAPDQSMLYYEFAGLLAIGETSDALESLDRLREVNPMLAAYGDGLLRKKGVTP